MKIAAIDIGTNSTRLLIVDYIDCEYNILERDIITTRLGEGVDKNGYLNKNAVKRTINALEIYNNKVKKYGVDETKVVGTSALRDVKNDQEFVELVKEKTFFDLEVISGNEEASYIYSGVKSDINEENFLIIDIGGGSTEFIWKKNNKLIEKSLNVGAVRLTERNIRDKNKVLNNKNYKALKNEIEEIIDGSEINSVKAAKMIGVGGTITTLAAMDIELVEYDSKKIHHYLLSKKNIDKIFVKLSQSNLDERKKMKGLNEGRADIITAGTVILKLIMEKFDFSEILISERDILFGLINEVIKK